MMITVGVTYTDIICNFARVETLIKNAEDEKLCEILASLLKRVNFVIYFVVLVG